MKDPSHRDEILKAMIQGWRLTPTNENVLIALLLNGLIALACDACSIYHAQVDKDLLTFCLEHDDETFLKHAFKSGYMNPELLEDSEVFKKILMLFLSERNTYLLFKVLAYCRISNLPMK